MKHATRLVVLCCALAVACAGEDAGGLGPPGGAAADDWQLYRGDSGLVLLHPAGWQVQERGGGAFAVFHPRPVGGADAVVAVQPIERIEGSVLTVVRELGKVLPDLFPGAAVTAEELRSRRPEVAVGELSYHAAGEAFTGTVLCFSSGGRGVLYAAATGPGAPPEAGAHMRRVLQSFLYAAPEAGAGPPAAPTRMIDWRDPMEDAFSCPVPAGWTVEGGLVRFHAVDVRPEVLVSSPDGRVLVRLGDSWIPPFVTPGPALTTTGFGPGMWYSPDGLLRVLVQSYLPGAEFVTAVYLPQRTGGGRVTVRQDLPDVSAQAAALWQRAGINVRVDTGEVEFSTGSDGDPRTGYALAQTVFLPMMGSPADGNWFVTALHGYVSTPAREGEARAVLAAMVDGFRMNPRWVSRMVQTAGEVSRITYETQERINDIIHQGYADRQESLDRTAERRAQSNRGMTVIEDPATGEQFEVPLGSNYWWRLDEAGPLLGSEGALTPELPGYWVREMSELR